MCIKNMTDQYYCLFLVMLSMYMFVYLGLSIKVQSSHYLKNHIDMKTKMK